MTVENTIPAQQTHDDATPPEKSLGPRKRSILFNMMMPPEAPPVDANLALPPVHLFPAIPHELVSATVTERNMGHVTKDPCTTAVMVGKEEETSATFSTHSLKSWIWGSSGSGQLTKRGGEQKKHVDNPPSKKNEGVVKVVESKQTTTTVVSKSTQIRSWISKMGRSDQNKKEKVQAATESAVVKASGSVLAPQSEAATTLPGQVPHECGHQGDHVHQQKLTTTTTTSQVTTTTTKTVALVSLNLSVSDIFGIGKLAEIILALFHAHGGFLKRQPFWLQVVLLAWEATVILLLVWGVLRIVGLAEVVVWGADDLVRGTISVLQMATRSLQGYLTG
ncbi:hypothetical protein CPC16_006059 [Podila verticillata]|nr:hypothetical protein BGZ52_001053 [Haplosporangium bisporale]KAF9214329.1 hypothetical protein BGZ59_003933 [Podila verticillata]KAF9389101.1 hypothetical protein CPC16_006059 [Podila verticillata]KAI9236830.1 MAG: hypothetical protein BYD32DRAFT_417763 [Podila humilis]KFH73580.1 hypothetical protein MVEG_00795 [Podila verticillata NRRL 6337]